MIQANPVCCLKLWHIYPYYHMHKTTIDCGILDNYFLNACQINNFVADILLICNSSSCTHMLYMLYMHYVHTTINKIPYIELDYE